MVTSPVNHSNGITGLGIKSIREIELSNKPVFIRVDFNVPIKAGKITDDTRIKEALPTIRYALEQNARVVLGSHLGRPDGKVNSEFSLEPVGIHLAELLGREVLMADDCIGDGIELMVQSMKSGQVLLLQNLRFEAGEEKNDPDFARRLARLAPIYINDAFGTAHRKHASTYGYPAIALQKGVGFLIEKEVKFLEPLIQNPTQPFYVILGGAKVTDKIKTIQSLMRNVQGICIGGAMAHAFWAAEGKSIPPGAKQPKPEDIEAARIIYKEAAKKEIPFLTPVDTNQGFDIGPKTVELFSDFVKKAKTVFWNGPLGWFEKPEYAVGTFAVAKALSELDCVKVVGGGDTVSAIHSSGLSEKFEHLSTGGGAVLEYLEHHGLPGIEILRTYQKNVGPAPFEFHEDREEE